jgi:hypothetical protein
MTEAVREITEILQLTIRVTSSPLSHTVERHHRQGDGHLDVPAVRVMGPK